MIGSISVEKRQNNSQGEAWWVRRVGKQSCPAYGNLQRCHMQPGTGAALSASQISKSQCHSLSQTEQRFGLNGWDLTVVIGLFVDIFSF